MTPNTVHDLMLVGIGLVSGGLIKEAIDQLGTVWHNARLEVKPLAVSSHCHETYDRQPTHVERVSSMLDSIERRSGTDRRKS